MSPTSHLPFERERCNRSTLTQDLKRKMMRRLGLLALASAGAAAFAPTVPGGRLALRRSHVASQRPTGARHRVVCQANAAPVTVEVDATEVEPFLAFPGVSDKVRRTQRVRV